MDQLLSNIEQSLPSMLEDLQALVEHETPSLHKSSNDRLSRYIADLLMNRIGGHSTFIGNETYGDVLKWKFGEGVKKILLLAHTDTVWKHGVTQLRPFRVDGDRAIGPGTLDMKGGIVQAMYAIMAIHKLSIPFQAAITLLLTTDEEIGSPSSKALIEAEAKLSDYVLVLEPATEQEHAVKTSRKGIGRFKLDVTGKAAHAGLSRELGVDAIEELMHQIQCLYSFRDEQQGTSINVGAIGGGLSSNVIAPNAWAEIEIRTSSMSAADELLGKVQNVQPTMPGAGLAMSGGWNRPPMERTDGVAELYYRAQKLARQQLEFELLESASGGGSDGSFAAKYAPTLDGLGACGEGAHCDHEFVYISQIPLRSALLAHLLVDLSSN